MAERGRRAATQRYDKLLKLVRDLPTTINDLEVLDRKTKPVGHLELVVHRHRIQESG